MAIAAPGGTSNTLSRIRIFRMPQQSSDNIDGSYFQAGLQSWEPAYASDLHRDQPFGAGLKTWLENAPAFNVERIRTPLQIQVTDTAGGLVPVITTGWELFTRLRFLRKPVELYVLPNIMRGSHVPQNPAQLQALQQRTLDWWCFWLKSEERPDADQYQAWRLLRQLHEDQLAQPRPPRLKWSVQPQ